MEFIKSNNTYVVRLEKGEEVLASLKKLCEDNGIKAGEVTGIGATDYVKVGLFNVGTKEYASTIINEPMEITSLMGNISTKDGENYLHLHINVATADMMVHGGHLNECRISATCEIYVNVFDQTVERRFDNEIGLNLYKF